MCHKHGCEIYMMRYAEFLKCRYLHEPLEDMYELSLNDDELALGKVVEDMVHEIFIAGLKDDMAVIYKKKLLHKLCIGNEIVREGIYLWPDFLVLQRAFKCRFFR